MAFPERFLDELVARSDLVDIAGGYTSLQLRGGRYWGLCPFHSEKTASFSVQRDAQLYYCFGCSRGGGVGNFVMEAENLSFPDAVRFLAKRAGMEVPEEEGEGNSGSAGRVSWRSRRTPRVFTMPASRSRAVRRRSPMWKNAGLRRPPSAVSDWAPHRRDGTTFSPRW
jgi:DNA primase